MAQFFQRCKLLVHAIQQHIARGSHISLGRSQRCRDDLTCLAPKCEARLTGMVRCGEERDARCNIEAGAELEVALPALSLGAYAEDSPCDMQRHLPVQIVHLCRTADSRTELDRFDGQVHASGARGGARIEQLNVLFRQNRIELAHLDECGSGVRELQILLEGVGADASRLHLKPGFLQCGCGEGVEGSCGTDDFAPCRRVAT
mmetsp:Transcript_32951/g.63482  ORF Transcript_32951/g.63482 Transcript_32951/m.63482 type:complete len:203 (-) Transcript_32951:529-1137(-)